MVKPDIVVPSLLFALSLYSSFPLSIMLETQTSQENEKYTARDLRLSLRWNEYYHLLGFDAV
jgi:hypothetical protein